MANTDQSKQQQNLGIPIYTNNGARRLLCTVINQKGVGLIVAFVKNGVTEGYITLGEFDLLALSAVNLPT